MPVTPAQAVKLALELRPEVGPEQEMLLNWAPQHREGWPDCEEANIQSMMLAKLGELLPAVLRCPYCAEIA